MKTHVFDIYGHYALFRKPYSPMSPVSFPFPPPPTVLGMVGAICGYSKENYFEDIGWDRIKIGIGIQSKVEKFRTGINLVNTKENPFPRLAGLNPRIQIPHEFLKNVRFRIYVANGKNDMMKELKDHLVSGTITYTLSLGLAQCLGYVGYIGTYEARAEPSGEHQVDSVVPKESVERIFYSPNGSYGHYRIPVKMEPGRRVTEYKITIAEEQAQSIRVLSNSVFSVGDENVIFF